MRVRYRCEECDHSFEKRNGHRCGSDWEERTLSPFPMIGVEDIPDGESGDIRIVRETLSKETNVAGNWHPLKHSEEY